jgi:hypothetical protein
MGEPFIYIGNYRIKHDKVREGLEILRAMTPLIEQHEPQLGAFHFFFDPATERVTCVQVHPNPQSMATHMAVIANHLDTAWDWLDQDSVTTTALGTPPDVLTNYARAFNEPLELYPTHLAGFTRIGTP